MTSSGRGAVVRRSGGGAHTSAHTPAAVPERELPNTYLLAAGNTKAGCCRTADSPLLLQSSLAVGTQLWQAAWCRADFCSHCRREQPVRKQRRGRCLLAAFPRVSWCSRLTRMCLLVTRNQAHTPSCPGCCLQLCGTSSYEVCCRTQSWSAIGFGRLAGTRAAVGWQVSLQLVHAYRLACRLR